MELSKRQREIIAIVKEDGPITSEQIASRLNLSRATLRPDLAVLTMAGFLEARPRVGYFYTGQSQLQLLTEKVKQYTVEDFQSKPIVVNEKTSVHEAITTMFSYDVGTLFVVCDNDYLSGVISRKDLLRASFGNQDLQKIAVHIIMTRMPNITFCRPEDLLIDAAKLLIEKEIDGIPVVKGEEEKYEIVGRITKTTITEAFVQLTRGK